MSPKFKYNLIAITGLILCLSCFGLAFAFGMYTHDSDFAIWKWENGLFAGVCCLAIMSIGVFLFYIATKIASKVEIPFEQKKYSVNFYSYTELTKYCEPIFLKYGYKKLIGAKTKDTFSDFVIYIKLTDDNIAYCFTVCYMEKMNESAFSKVRDIINRSFASFYDKFNFSARRELKHIHYITLFCVDEENEVLAQLQKVPMLNYFSRYGQNKSDMILSLLFSKNILFIPPPAYEDLSPSHKSKQFFKAHLDELSKFFDLSREIK